ncbi:MAG TPA: DUF1559 domain-containing protein [Planctomycetaceae bacterium]|nr:DUF1559 domain-containing protein [Planctomycetaceae bacterium]
MLLESTERGGWGRMELAAAAFIVLLVIALGIPALLSTRERARRQLCADRLHLLAQGTRIYSVQFDAFPYGSVVNEKLSPEKRLSWYVGAWPFPVLKYELYQKTELAIDLGAAWDAAENRAPRIRIGDETRPFARPAMFRCPAAGVVVQPGDGPGLTEFVGMAGLGKQASTLPRNSHNRGVWNADLQTQPGEITRGESHVLLLIETAQDNGAWTASGLPTLRGFDPKGPPPVGAAAQFGGWHAGGANAVYVDEHVQFISDRIDPRVFSPLCLIARPE